MAIAQRLTLNAEVAPDLPVYRPGSRETSTGKVVGRRRVEQAHRPVSVNSGGDLPPLWRMARPLRTGHSRLRMEGRNHGTTKGQAEQGGGLRYRQSVLATICPLRPSVSVSVFPPFRLPPFRLSAFRLPPFRLS